MADTERQAANSAATIFFIGTPPRGREYYEARPKWAVSLSQRVLGRAASYYRRLKTRGGKTRMAADIGGTFTDVAAFDPRSGQLLLGKTLSTPGRLVDGISHGAERARARFADAALFLHGSTIAINTMLERTGAKTALLTTEGFRDTYEIGRINRPDSYNLFFKKHVPL